MTSRRLAASRPLAASCRRRRHTRRRMRRRGRRATPRCCTGRRAPHTSRGSCCPATPSRRRRRCRLRPLMRLPHLRASERRLSLFFQQLTEDILAAEKVRIAFFIILSVFDVFITLVVGHWDPYRCSICAERFSSYRR